MIDRRTPIPFGKKRACLCKDGTYSRKCCGKDHTSQGIGNVTRTRYNLYTEEGEKFTQENGFKLFQ